MHCHSDYQSLDHSIAGPSSVTTTAKELVPTTPADVNPSSPPVGPAQETSTFTNNQPAHILYYVSIL